MLQNIARRLRSERGIALPVAVSALMITGALAGAAATSAMTADRGSTRDRSVKRAVAAADAGLSIAAYRLNHFAKALTPTLQCVSLNATTGLLQVEAALGDNWCREQTEDLGEGASYRYRVSTRVQTTIGGQLVWQRKIVSTGVSNGVQRRAISTVAAPTGTPLFSGAVVSDQDLIMRNSAKITGSVRSNGNVVQQNSSTICGNVQVGPAKSVRSPKISCGGSSTVATEPYVLTPVVLPASNDNGRLTSGADPRSGLSWNPTTRVLSGDGTVILRGTNYVFCRLHLTGNARVIIENDGSPVMIYIDAPERCGATAGNPTGMGSVLFEQKGQIDNQGVPAMAQLYVTGSKDPRYPTSVSIRNSHPDGVKMTVYAPNSTFSLSNNSVLIGAVVAKQITLSNAAQVIWDGSAGGVLIAGSPLQMYKRQSWVECRPTQQGATPDGGC
jgi:Tfp pilus assembly protein PilX